MSNQARGGIFGAEATDAGTRDIGIFPSVPARPWPPGPRSVMGTSPQYQDIGFSKVGMGDFQSSVQARQISSVAQPMDPRSVMVNRLPKLGQAGGRVARQGYTPKGGILDGSTVDVGYSAGGGYFQEKEPRVIGTGKDIRTLPDNQLGLRNIGQRSLMPTPGPVNGFGDAASAAQPVQVTFSQPVRVAGVMPSQPIPVAVSFARPRMMGKSVFGGPVVRDNFPRESIMPTLGPVNGFGAGPDGLGGCGCGDWKRNR